jgi:ATP-dependent DNA helicase RecG
LDKILKILHGGVNDGVNGGVNEIVGILLNVSGLNALEIATRINKSSRTTERYLRILRKKGIVEFRGIPKTGGYYLTEKANNKLK